MRKQLFMVRYINKKSEEPDAFLLVSDGFHIREDVQKAIKDGRIETLQENPTILGYSYIDGYAIEPVFDSLENIYEALRVARKEQTKKGEVIDLDSYFGYLEGIRDFLNACRKDWKEEDKKILENKGKKIEVNVDEDEVAYAEFNEGDEVDIHFFSRNSNIPNGYNDEGRRI